MVERSLRASDLQRDAVRLKTEVQACQHPVELEKECLMDWWISGRRKGRGGLFHQAERQVKNIQSKEETTIIIFSPLVFGRDLRTVLVHQG